MPSIRDVAKAAEVSPATVSLVLNNKPGAAARTRERVRTTAMRLGYRNNTQPQPTRETHNYHLAVVCAYHVLADGDLTNEARAWIAGIRQAVSARGCHMTIYTAKHHCDEDHFFRQTLEAHEIQGVILLGVSADDGYLDHVQRCGVPSVLFNRCTTEGQFSWVSMENERTGGTAVDHLISKGHQGIAVCGDPNLPHARQRREGAIAALQQHQLEPVYISPLAARMSDHDFNQELDRILDAHVTAVFVSDWGGARLVDALTERGIQTPEQMSVIDVGDMCLNTQCGKQVTSMGYDKQWVGKLMGDVVIRLLAEGPYMRSVGEFFDTQIVERDTVASPRADLGVALAP